MNQIILTKEQVEELVFSNKYNLDEKKERVDVDFVLLVAKAGESFGFDTDKEKAGKVISKLKLASKKENEDKNTYAAVLQIQGNFSVNSSFSLESDQGTFSGKIYIFQQTFLHDLLQKIANELISQKAVKLFPGCDEEYLYEVLSSTLEDTFYETARTRAKNIPIYLVKFDDEGGFKVEEMGSV